VQILIVLRVEAADGFGEPRLGDGDEFRAAEFEVEGGTEIGFEVVEPEFDFLPLLLEAFDEFAFGFLSDGGEILAEETKVGSVFVGGHEFGMDVGVAHLACCAAQFAKRALERLGLLVDPGDIGGESEQFERGFDASGGGAQKMDALGRGFFEAFCDGSSEHQALTEKDGNRLRHNVTLP